MGAERPVRVALFGLGRVGRAFLELLAEDPRGMELVAAVDSSGAAIDALDPAEVASAKAEGSFRGAERGVPAEVLERADADVAVDVSSCDFATGEPSRSILAAALDGGRRAVTANKAPLARGWTELVGGRADAIGYAAAAGAALPAVAVARSLARVDRLASVEGVLTGTATFVLDEMTRGVSLADAVAAAREAGIAEPDPGVDVGGWDTAAKLVIIANTVWPDATISLDDVGVSGVEAVAPSELLGSPVRIVGRAERYGDLVGALVGPLPVPPDHPLGVLRGRDKGVVFRGPNVGDVVVTGGRSHPRGAAAAALGDVRALAARRS